VNLLAKPIADVHTAADFSSVMSMMRELGVTPGPVSSSLQPPLQSAGFDAGGLIPAQRDSMAARIHAAVAVASA
jgi:hypothetical protein